MSLVKKNKFREGFEHLLYSEIDLRDFYFPDKQSQYKFETLNYKNKKSRIKTTIL